MQVKDLQMKRALRIVLFVLLIGVAGITKVFAQYFSVGDLNYQVIYGTTNVILRGHASGISGTLTIPSTVVYNDVTYTVTKIGEYAFSGCTNLYGDLVIPNTVKEIEPWAFNNCYGLGSNLTMSNSIQKIGNRAFYNCWFSNVSSFPNSLISIGAGAFYGNEWYWNQPDGILYLNNWCLGYKGDKPTGDLIIQGNIKGVGDGTFSYCPELVSVTLPNTIKHIGAGAFENCYNLTSVNIPNTVITIGESAFAGTSLSSIVLGNSVTTIGAAAFSGCPFTSVNIPNTVTTIGESAFAGSGITSIDIPNSVISIGNSAFCGTALESITIPNSITTINDGVFAGCQSLSSVYIPGSVTTIEGNAFYGCTSLTSIDLNSVTFVGMMAFMECTGFTEFTFPNSVEWIGDGVFNYCTNLTSVYFGNSVSYIEGRLFNGCPNVQQIIVAPDNPIYDSRDNCNAAIYTSQNRLDVGCKTTVIPNTVTAIGSTAFWGCSQLSSIVIPNTVTTIGWGAFMDCVGLTSIDLPDELTEIGEGAFIGCSGLISIDIPNSVTSLGSSAFSWCTNLASITIPNAVTTIGNQIFEGCSSMTHVNLLGTIPPDLGFYGYAYDIDFPTSNEGFTIYVPYESLETYKTAANWSVYESYIQPLYYTTIPGYGSTAGNWRFIASPLEVTTAPATVENLISETEHDLYQFNQSATDGEWQNYKANNFNLLNGQGYLYANENDVNIIFKGDFNENDTKMIALAYESNVDFAGWNLVGNPFPVSAYANRSYYVMNEEGTAIEPVAVSMETAIPACTGVMVKADNEGETVTFNKTAPRGQENQGVLRIAVMQANTRGAALMDKAIVSFNAGDKLEKFVFNKDNAQLFIPRGKDNYAIISAENTGEVPLNFEAKKNGTYTITVDSELADVDYLHLIDNLTGEDVDLLTQPAYTFESRTTDYVSRFRLVFSANETDDTSTGSEVFAFINSNGNLTIYGIEGEATLQVVDAQGHVLGSETFSGSYEKKLNVAPGVYLLRLVNGDNIKVQKIIVE